MRGVIYSLSSVLMSSPFVVHNWNHNVDCEIMWQLPCLYCVKHGVFLKQTSVITRICTSTCCFYPYVVYRVNQVVMSLFKQHFFLKFWTGSHWFLTSTRHHNGLMVDLQKADFSLQTQVCLYKCTAVFLHTFLETSNHWIRQKALVGRHHWGHLVPPPCSSTLLRVLSRQH